MHITSEDLQVLINVCARLRRAVVHEAHDRTACDLSTKRWLFAQKTLCSAIEERERVRKAAAQSDPVRVTVAPATS